MHFVVNNLRKTIFILNMYAISTNTLIIFIFFEDITIFTVGIPTCIGQNMIHLPPPVRIYIYKT